MRFFIPLLLLASSPALAQSSALQAGQARPITAEERAQGARLDEGITAEFGGALSGRQAVYAEAVGRRIATRSGLAASPGAFKVTLLDSAVDNAFALPGGYVYLTRNLMALMNDEAELAAVMGHEVAHVAARHAARRQSAATRNSVLGAIGQAIVGAVAGNSGVGGLLSRGVGAGAQLATLGYSRGQETESDDLAVRYLAGAGYDPLALSTMLESLAEQSELTTALTGQARTTARWASTHPDPGSRVRRAEQQAAAVRAAPSSLGGTRNREAFLAAIDGMPYGEDPAGGVIEGRRFLHPGLGVQFDVPAGFTMQNGAAAVSIAGQGAQGQFAAASYRGDLDGYIAELLRAVGVSGSAGPAERTTVNGIPAAYTQVQASANGRTVDVTVFAYRLSASQAAHFLIFAPAGQGPGALEESFGSLRRLAPGAVSARRRFVRVVTVRAGETAAGLAARMAYPDYRTERFLVLNRLPPGAALRPGDRVKIVTF